MRVSASWGYTTQRCGFGKQVSGDGQARLAFGNWLDGLRVHQLHDGLVLYAVRTIRLDDHILSLWARATT
jgi:hypothetical protein